MKKALAFIAALLCATSAQAQAPDNLYMGGMTYHVADGYRDVNPGIGLGWSDVEALGVRWHELGLLAYKNSEYKNSVAVVARYKLGEIAGADASVTVGAVTGYSRMTVAPLALVSVWWRYFGVEMAPPVDKDTAFVSLQFRIPLGG